MLDSDRTFKIKVRSRWIVFRIFLTSQLIAFKEVFMAYFFPKVFNKSFPKININKKSKKNEIAYSMARK